ncbi:MAG: CHAT domain-containing protein [Bacteroidetes bacterium]|nr:CHAT domain-containing protein [Bacteroidota bacterium]MBS1940358.1 CHAT domain-containing protein [Bacteroidota bacterium]
MRSTVAWLMVALPLLAGAQGLAKRHALIDQAYKAEQYAEVVRLIDAQLKEVPGTPWQDSIQQYVYPYGRATGKLKGVDAGIAAAEQITGMLGAGSNAVQRINALFDLSWIYYEAGRVKGCIRSDSTAVAIAEGHAEVPAIKRGQAQQYLAFDYSILGDHRRSLEHAQAALDAYSRAGTVPAKQWAESYTAVGTAYWHLGRIRDAERAYRRSLEVLGDGESEALLVRKVSVHGNLGVLWQNAGDLVRSKAEYHESLRLCDRILATTTDPSTRDEITVNRSRTYLNLATVYFDAGDDGRAQELLDLAWADRSKVLQPDDPQLLSVRDRMADIELAAGALDRAEAFEQAYLAACERQFGRKSEEYIRACSKLGLIAARKGDHQRADSLFALSMAYGRLNADPASDAVLATTLKQRARMRGDAGRTQEAMADLAQAKRIMVNMYGAGNYRAVQCDVLLAEEAFAAGRFAESARQADSALVSLRDRVDALRANGQPVFFPDPGLLSDAVYWKVKAERAMEAPGTIGKEWQADLDLAIASLGRNRVRIKDAASKLRLMAAQQKLFGLALDLAYDAYARSHAEADVERFLQLSEANRSLLLKGRLNEFTGMQFGGIPDSVSAHEQELLAALDIDDAQRASATEHTEHEKAYNAFLGTLEREYPHYFSLRYGDQAPSIAQIREQLLAPDRQLLAYAQSAEHLYAVVIGLDRADLVRMEPGNLDQVVKDLRTAVASRQRNAFTEQAYHLYQLVFAPVAPMLTGNELLIIPDGPLHTLNFEMLLSAPGTKDFKEHFLIQRYAIGYLLSATTALQFAGLSRGRANGTLALAPGFTEQTKQEYLAQVKDSGTVDDHYLHFVRQPFAVRTAQTLGRTASAAVLTGGSASEEAFRKDASQYGILFLGTHAEMDPVDPMYSSLVLSKDGDGTAHDGDGYLHAYELYALDLNAQLAVIAACETGNGKVDPGEGVRSLGAGFAYAGCPSLVAALWSIDEKTSAAILESFFNHLSDGMPKHLALRQAKLDFLADAHDEAELPYYWAGLVLTGDVRPVVQSGTPWWWWGLGGAALLILVVVLVRARSRRGTSRGAENLHAA